MGLSKQVIKETEEVFLSKDVTKALTELKRGYRDKYVEMGVSIEKNRKAIVDNANKKARNRRFEKSIDVINGNQDHFKKHVCALLQGVNS